MLSTTQIARHYYEAFNARDFAAAEALVHPGAVFRYPHSREHPTGRAGYRDLVGRWLEAFPDVLATIERVTPLGDDVTELHLLGRGTHRGPLDFGGPLKLPPTGVSSALPFRDVLHVRDGQIVESTFRFDITELVLRLIPGTGRRPKDVLVVDDERDRPLKRGAGLLGRPDPADTTSYEHASAGTPFDPGRATC